MKVIQPINNCCFVIDDNGNCHCFSYGSEVAAIVDDKYVEYETPAELLEANKNRKNPDIYNSPTSRRHKSMFRAQFDI